MTHLKINIAKLGDNISRYKNIINKCNEDIDNTYGNLKNIDSGWSDTNSSVFLNDIKKHEYNVKSYLDSIDSLYKIVEKLKDNFNDLLFKYNLSTDSYLQYNDEYFDKCITNFNNVISYLNSALSYVNSCNFKATFSEIYRVNTLRNEIKNIKKSVNELIGLVTSFKNDINKIISNRQSEVNKLDSIIFNVSKLEYNWNIVGTNVSYGKTENVSQINISSNDISNIKLNDDLVNSNSSFISNDKYESIVVNEQKLINNNNVNLNSDSLLNDVDIVDNLNTDSVNLNSSNIDNLDKNINVYDSDNKKNNINLSNIDEIDNSIDDFF